MAKDGPSIQTLDVEGVAQVNRWLGHAKTYVQQVLAPRAEYIQTEVCIGVNWVTGEAEVFPDVKDRNYPERDGWMFGTADLVAKLWEGPLWVGDWKSGGTDGAKEQLLSLGVGFKKALGASALTICCLPVNDHGVWPDETQVTEEEAQNHWDSMRFAWEDIPNAQPVRGIQCSQMYCPHLAYCSAITNIVSDVAAQDGKSPDDTRLVAPGRLIKDFRLTDRPGSQEEAGHVMAMVTAANRQTKYLTAVMKDYVKKGGRVTCGQYEWKEGSNGFRWGRQK